MYKIRYEAQVFIDTEYILDEPTKLSKLYKNRNSITDHIKSLLPKSFGDIYIRDFETEPIDDCLVEDLPYSYDYTIKDIISVGAINNDITHTIEDYIIRKHKLDENTMIFVEWELCD